MPGGRRILQERTVKAMVSHDWLAMPECIGQPQINEEGLGGITGRGRFGWNAVGELGMNEDQEPPDAFEMGEYGYGGIAETYWSINPRRGLVILWFSQQVDNHSWSSEAANLWLAARAAVANATWPYRADAALGAASQVPKRRRVRKKAPGVDIAGTP